MLKTKKPSQQRGFTLVEVVAAIGILAAVMIGFSTLLGSVGASQQILERERVATRALTNEVEKIQATRWDDLMPRTTPYAPCEIEDLRTANPTIFTTPEVVSTGRVAVTITRTVKWHLSDSLVACDDESKNRAEPKVVEITATWDNGKGKTMTASTKVIRSRWTEGPTNTKIGTRASLAKEVSMSSSAGWCPSYSENGSTATSAGSATSTGTTMGVRFNRNSGICGPNVTGLTPGSVYTAVLDVYVPVGSQPVELGVQGGIRGGVVPADGQWYKVTATWTQSGTSVVVGPKIQTGVTNPGFSEAIVNSLKIYQH